MIRTKKHAGLTAVLCLLLMQSTMMISAMTNIPFADDALIPSPKPTIESEAATALQRLKSRIPETAHEELEEEMIPLFEEVIGLAQELKKIETSQDIKNIEKQSLEDQKKKERDARQRAKKASSSRSSQWSPWSGSPDWRKNDWGRGSGGDDWWSNFEPRSGGSDRWDDPWSSSSSQQDPWDKESTKQADRQPEKERTLPDTKNGSKEILSGDKKKAAQSKYDKTLSALNRTTQLVKQYADQAQKLPDGDQEKFAKQLLNEGFFSSLSNKVDDTQQAHTALKDKINEKELVTFDKDNKNKLAKAEKNLTNEYKRLFPHALHATTLLEPTIQNNQALQKEQGIGLTMLINEFKNKAITQATFDKEVEKRSDHIIKKRTPVYKAKIKDIPKQPILPDRPITETIGDKDKKEDEEHQKLQTFFQKQKLLFDGARMLMPPTSNNQGRKKFDAEIKQIDTALNSFKKYPSFLQQKQEFKTKVEDIDKIKIPTKTMTQQEKSELKKDLVELKTYFNEKKQVTEKQKNKLTSEIEELNKNIPGIQKGSQLHKDETKRRDSKGELIRKSFTPALEKIEKHIEAVEGKLEALQND